MYIVHVTYQVKPGERDAFLAALGDADISAKTEAEPGCLQYRYYAAAGDEDQALLVERWSDREALGVHMQGENIARVREIQARYVADSTITLYEAEERKL